MRSELYPGAPKDVLDALESDITVETVFALQSPHASFGGLSGLWVAPDGSRMIAISDIGQHWQARLYHDDAGRLTGLDSWSVADLTKRPEDGDGSRWIDSEALSDDGQGGLVVAYEGLHRLRRWPLADFDAEPLSMVLPKGLGGPSNSGIEAMSTLEDGRLFALAERVGASGGEGLMGWVVDEEAADDLVYIPGPDFAPTGADRLESTVYVVERSFSLLSGFRTRIVALPSDAIKPDARLEGAELAAFRWGNFGENFEGIAARRGPNGQTFLYLLSDDNFSFLQETLMVQLSISTSRAAD
ncbi:MAG: esterase-like activity of phytase family protein [Geminicoccaceae bacterium]